MPTSENSTELSTRASEIFSSGAFDCVTGGLENQGVRGEGSRDGFRYLFSPLSPKDGNSPRSPRSPLSPKHGNGPRRWKSRKWSGRGWSQFGMVAEMTEWKNPDNPDLTPQKFWNGLEEFRKMHTNVRESLKADELVHPLPVSLPVHPLPVSLPQIVPKLNLARLPQCSSSKGKGMITKMNSSRCKNILSITPVRVGDLSSGAQNERGNVHHENASKGMDALDIRRQRSILESDEEIKGIQYSKLGIKPQGTVWNLRRLLISENKFLETMQVAAAIMANPNLEELDIRGNCLDATCGSILATVLIQHPRFRELSGIPLRRIRENFIKDVTLRPDPHFAVSVGPAEIVVLGAFLIESCSLVKLDLRGINVGREGFFSLGLALRAHTDLTHLDLSRTGMDAESLDKLLPGLLNSTELLQLHLAMNGLDAAAMHSVAHVMSKSWTHLQVLDLRNNLLGPDGAVALVPALHEHLTDVDLSNNRIGAKACSELVRSFKCRSKVTNEPILKNLTHLNLSFNGLDMQGAWALVDALPVIYSLKTLKLHCKIPVSDLRSQRVLSMTGMGFGDIEGVIVSAQLKRNIDLQSLDLRGNELGPMAYRCLSTALVSLPNLCRLNEQPFDSEMQPSDVDRILRAGMSVPIFLSKTPEMTTRKRFTFADAALKMRDDIEKTRVDQNMQKNKAAGRSFESFFQEISKEHTAARKGRTPRYACTASCLDLYEAEDKVSRDKDDEDELYQSTYESWKESGVRPSTDAVSSDDSESNEPDGQSHDESITVCDATAEEDVQREGGTDAHSESSDKGLVLRVSTSETSRSRKTGGISRTSSLQENFRGKLRKSNAKKVTMTIDMPPESPPEAKSSRRDSVMSAYSSKASPIYYNLQPPPKTRSSFQDSTPKIPNFKRQNATVRLLSGLTSNVLTSNRICHYSGSQMGADGAKKLARQLNTMPARFASVDLSLCDITGLDENSEGQIDLSGFKALCKVLQKNEGITSLNLAWNRIGSKAVSILKTVLAANTSLVILDLYKNDIQEDGFKILAPSFKCMPFLQELNLRYNRIGPVGAAMLAENLEYMPNLVTLDVAANSFGSLGLENLVPSLARLSRLACAQLDENEAGVEGHRILVDYIMRCPTSLEELNRMSLNRFLEYVPLSLENLPTNFENYEALYLAGEFAKATERGEVKKIWILHTALSRYLETIDLSWCHLQEFPESILILMSLKALDVSYNKLEHIPVMKICATTALTELKCNGNYALNHPPTEIADQGGKAVMLFLKETMKDGMKDDEIALITVGAESVGKTSCLSCLVTGLGKNARAKESTWYEREFEDGTPLFRGEPLFDRKMLDSLITELDEHTHDFCVNDRDSSCLGGAGGTVVANMMYWRATDQLQFLIWDLPGHSFYAATNRLFFVRRAVFLLVWRVKEYSSDELVARAMGSVCKEITSSMDIIQSSCPGAFCLVVATHIDVIDPKQSRKVAQQAQIVSKAIKQKLQEMRTQSDGEACLTVFNDGHSSLISSKTGDGIQDLQKDLIKFTSSLESFKSLYPKAFLQLRNGLRLIRNRNAVLHWDMYTRLADLCGIQGTALDVATRLLQARKYLNFFEGASMITLHKPKLNLTTEVHTLEGVEGGATASAFVGRVRGLWTMTKVYTTWGLGLKKAPGNDLHDRGIQEGDKYIITNPHWIIRVLRGLLNPDIELMIDWFSGSIQKKYYNPSLLNAALNLVTNGILESKLVFYLWPSLADLEYTAFWSAYFVKGTGPLKMLERQIASRLFDYNVLLKILEQLHIISRRTDSTFWVPAMKTGTLAGRSVITDARVFKAMTQGFSCEIRYNFLPPDFFSILMILCSNIKDEWTDDRVDRLDYCSKAATFYLKGNKAQLSISRAPRAAYYSLFWNASTLHLAHAVLEKIQTVEHVYPGLIGVGKEENNHENKPEEVPNVLFLFSRHAVPHKRILMDEVSKYDVSLKISSEQVPQLSTITASLSIFGRDVLRSRHINSMGKLRSYATSQGALSREKLLKGGFSEADTSVIVNSLSMHPFHGQVVMLCLDELYSDESECEWYSACKYVEGGAYLVLIVLPGYQMKDSVPAKPIAIIDLSSAEWIQEGRDLRLSYESRTELKKTLKPLTLKLVNNWCGMPEVIGDFDHPPVFCHACLQEGKLMSEKFDYNAHMAIHNAFLMRQLKTGNFTNSEHTVSCINDHTINMLEILTSSNELLATACPACIEQGKTLPHGFSRQHCLDVLNGKKTLQTHQNHDTLPGAKSNGIMLACPKCKSDQLDIVDILQAEAFVSYCKRKLKCTSCGRSNIARATDACCTGQHESAIFFVCQDCNTKFSQEEVDSNIGCVQRVVAHLEKNLNVLAVKPSIIYLDKELLPAGAHVLPNPKSAKVLIAFFDNAYVRSHACMEEFAAAVDSSRYIVPVLLPGYVGGANWYPADCKYKRSDGVYMVVPFSVLKYFSPITVELQDGKDEINVEKLSWAVMKAVALGLHGGTHLQQSIRASYEEWRRKLALLRSNLLGAFAVLGIEEMDRKISRIWRRHGSSLGEIRNLQQQLGNFGIKTTDDEITCAFSEIHLKLNMMGVAEFRHFMCNLISNIIMKLSVYKV